MQAVTVKHRRGEGVPGFYNVQWGRWALADWPVLWSESGTYWIISLKFMKIK